MDLFKKVGDLVKRLGLSQSEKNEDDDNNLSFLPKQMSIEEYEQLIKKVAPSIVADMEESTKDEFLYRKLNTPEEIQAERERLKREIAALKSIRDKTNDFL